MPLKCGSESTDYHWYQVHKAEADLDTLRRLTVEETHPAYQRAWQARGEALGKVGYKSPRIQAWLIDWATYSPTLIRLIEDTELGFVAVVKAHKGAAPIYKLVSNEVAVAIIKGEVTPKLEKELLTPVEYYGE